jgi:hypothetical protein
MPDVFDALRWISVNTGLVWLMIGIGWATLFGIALRLRQAKRRRLAAFDKELFATTADLERWGLL